MRSRRKGSLDLLRPAPLRDIRIALTTRCNLRCVYCAVSQSTYHGEDMPADLARKTVALIPQVVDRTALHSLNVNGHGETTFMPGWVTICQALLDQGLPLTLTSNLAKALSTEELETLARMRTINVSIDTRDGELLRRMRRKVDVRQIVANMRMIREAAARLQHSPPPGFNFSCGLYDLNTLVIEDFADFAVEQGVERVGFWNLTKWNHEHFPYEYTDVPEGDRVRPLDELSDGELRPRLAAIQRAIAVLERNRIIVTVAGDFVRPLARRLDSSSKTQDAGLQSGVPSSSDGMTRDCLDPWTYLELGARGEIKPCCAHGSVGDFSNQDPSRIRNSEPLRRLRADLLQGTLDPDCVQCRLRGTVSTAELQAKVAALWEPPPDVSFGVRIRSFLTHTWLWLRLTVQLRTRLRAFASLIRSSFYSAFL